MKALFLSSLILLGLLLSSNFIQPAVSQSTPAPEVANDCGSNCESRCAVAGMKDRCLKYCGICCAKCRCVPSGTYGNKHQCPCYRDMRSSKGKPKCP